MTQAWFKECVFGLAGYGYEPDVIHRSGNVYIVSYGDWYANDTRQAIRTVEIDPWGDTINSIERVFIDLATVYGHPNTWSRIKQVVGSLHLLAYQIFEHGSKLLPIEISEDGNIGISYPPYTYNSGESGSRDDFTHVIGDVWAVVYPRYIKTFGMRSGSSMTGTIDVQEYTSSGGGNPNIVKLKDGVVAIAYDDSSPTSDHMRVVKSFNISPEGNIEDVVDTWSREWEHKGDMINVQGNLYALAMSDDLCTLWIQRTTKGEYIGGRMRRGFTGGLTHRRM